MNRTSRMLIVVGGFGLLSVIVLGSMAKRYETLLDPGDAPARPGWRGEQLQQQRVSDFVEVRKAVHAALQKAANSDGEVTLARLRETRDKSLKRVGMKRRMYLEVRAEWRRWKRVPAQVPANTAAAFEKRREELEALDLGTYESTDL